MRQFIGCILGIGVFALSPEPLWGQAVVHDSELAAERARTTVLQEVNYETAVRVREIVRSKLELLGRKTEMLTTVRGYQELLSRGELSVLGGPVTDWTEYSNPCELSEEAEEICDRAGSIADRVDDIVTARIIEKVIDRPLAEANYKLFSTMDEARTTLSELALSQLPSLNPDLQEAEQEAINAQADAAIRAEQRAQAINQMIQEIQEEERLNSEPISSGRAVQITAVAELASAMALLESTRERVRTARFNVFETAKKVSAMSRENELGSLRAF